MKKIIILAVTLIIISIMSCFSVFAENYAYTDGTDNIFTHSETFNIKYCLNDVENIYGMQGEIKFNGQIVEFENIECLIEDFEVQTEVFENKIKFVATNNNFNSPFSGSGEIFDLTFKILEQISDTKIKITFSNIYLSNMYTDYAVDNVSFNRVVSDEEFDSDPRLLSLEFKDSRLDREFESSRYEYRLEYSGELSEIEYEVTPLFSTTEVTVSGTDKIDSVGKTTITILCKAENGSEARYTVYAYPNDDITVEEIEDVSSTSSKKPPKEVSMKPNAEVTFIIICNVIAFPLCLYLLLRKKRSFKKEKK